MKIVRFVNYVNADYETAQNKKCKCFIEGAVDNWDEVYAELTKRYFRAIAKAGWTDKLSDIIDDIANEIHWMEFYDATTKKEIYSPHSYTRSCWSEDYEYLKNVVRKYNLENSKLSEIKANIL